MITFIETSRELTKVEKYLVSSAPTCISMKDVEDGTVISVDAIVCYQDDDKTIYGLLDTDKKAYGFQSKTFYDSVKEINDLFTDENGNREPYSIVKISGETKAGRHYINCVLNI